ncbi:MAG: M28 family peptidase [Ignavibacteriota bacterium]|nr:M28 family peptidase [Ignavibacteriales bacterium]MBL1123970.1 Zn-dependent exopeptidase M28 [Ignavibacteriota bacterium]MEB2295314.1 M28 family peptidase [Ignavibacteria bacterium]GJQ42769.1 MAG: hypothetical protein JETCAE03_22670 [Ignavibacteriaceae bacterium]QKJ94880.1 MAG: M28 family peptidase [Ignavibacteriota bacterium]
MKLKATLSLQFLFSIFCFSQTYDPFIEQVIDETNLDSLVSYVRILSGEDSVVIGDSTVLITQRVSSTGNDLAAEYIKEKLTGYGLEIYDQHYSASGRNIYAIQRGTLYPEEYYIYSAHYDAVTYFCADDDASGCAGVVEAARILSSYQFEYSIVYGFWDEEEIGLVGSAFFAEQADSNQLNIKGVIQFEMSGWDSNNDGLMDIHTRNISNSVLLGNFMKNIDTLYNLPTVPVVYNPGTTASDHSSFWQHNYSAICFSEAYYGGDFNPYYHSSQDRIDKFNLTYFHNVSKLGIATIAALALENFVVSVPDDGILPSAFSITNYPNPFNSSTIIQYYLTDDDNISLDL